MKSQNNRWQRLLKARKAAHAQSVRAAEDLTPPMGFVTRVSARAATARRAETLKLWRRWSLFAAVGSTCLFFVAVVYVAMTRDAGSILPVPSLELPQNL